MSDPGLGLPSASTGGVNTDPDRPHITYTLPEAHLGLSFGTKGFKEADRTFKLVEVSPRQQDRAAKVANGNASILGRELMFSALWRVGDWKPQRDRDRLVDWWDAIGGKGRRLVEAAFLKMQSVEEADVENFLASGQAST